MFQKQTLLPTETTDIYITYQNESNIQSRSCFFFSRIRLLQTLGQHSGSVIGQQHMFISTSGPSSGELSKKDQLKQAVKDYGKTVIVFHVAISLASLGGFYTAVSR